MSDRVAAAIAGAFTAAGVIALVVGDAEGRLIGLTAIVLFGGGTLVVRAARTDPDPGGAPGAPVPDWLTRARRRRLLTTLVGGLALGVGAILLIPVAAGDPRLTAAAWTAGVLGAVLLIRSAVVLAQVGSDPTSPGPGAR